MIREIATIYSSINKNNNYVFSKFFSDNGKNKSMNGWQKKRLADIRTKFNHKFNANSFILKVILNSLRINYDI